MSGYMIAPLYLSERQILIYHCLYKKCDFKDMSVRITTAQIITDIKIVDLSVKIVNNELKKMVDDGYLRLIKKGAKGNCSIYEIVKTNEVEQGNLYASYTQVKGNLKVSDSNTSNDVEGSYRQSIGNLKAIPNKEKEKEKEIYSDSFNRIWDLYPRKVGKPKAFSMYKKLKKKYTDEQIMEAVETYVKEIEYYKTEDRFIKHGSTFFNCIEEDYIKANKKAPTGIGAGNKNTNYGSSICNNYINNTPKVEGSKFI